MWFAICLSCTVLSTALGTHPVDCSLLHKGLAMCLLSQMYACAIYTATAMPPTVQLYVSCSGCISVGWEAAGVVA
jgi:hypothetical protein